MLTGSRQNVGFWCEGVARPRCDDGVGVWFPVEDDDDCDDGGGVGFWCRAMTEATTNEV